MRTLIFVVLFSFFALSSFAQEIRKVKIAEVMTEMQKKDDKVRVLNLWATWCAPCVKELPYFEEVYQEHKGDTSLKIILLAVEDSEAKVKSFIQRKGIEAEVWLLDESDANMWIPQIDPDWAGEIPVTLVVNAKTEEKAFHSGELSKSELLELIEKVKN